VSSRGSGSSNSGARSPPRVIVPNRPRTPRGRPRTFANPPSTGPMGDGPKEHGDLIEEFVIVAEAIVDITSAQDVVNKVFN